MKTYGDLEALIPLFLKLFLSKHYDTATGQVVHEGAAIILRFIQRNPTLSVAMIEYCNFFFLFTFNFGSLHVQNLKDGNEWIEKSYNKHTKNVKKLL